MNDSSADIVKLPKEDKVDLNDELLNNGDAMLEFVSKFKGNKEAFEFYKEVQIHIVALEASTADASYNLAQLLANEDDGFDVDDYAGYCVRKKSLRDVIENNKSMRKQLISKFRNLAGDILDTPTEIKNIDYQFDKIADDEKVRNFKHYYELFCLYRYEFGKRAADIESFLLHTYKDEHETHRAYYAVNKSMNQVEPITFTFKLHKYRPYELSLRDLDVFNDNVKACMEVFYHMYKCTGNDMLNPDVVRDGKGRIVDREHPSKLFKRWERCLLTYDLSKHKELTLAQIARKSSEAIRNTSRHFTTDVDAASAAKKDIKEAENLIKSASKGTFPN